MKTQQRNRNHHKSKQNIRAEVYNECTKEYNSINNKSSKQNQKSVN